MFDPDTGRVTFLDWADFKSKSQTTIEIAKTKGAYAKSLISITDSFNYDDYFGLLWLAADLTALHFEVESIPSETYAKYLQDERNSGLMLWFRTCSITGCNETDNLLTIYHNIKPGDRKNIHSDI